MLLNRAHVLLKDEREDLRIKENGRIPWQIKYKQRAGNAKIRNISVSGMMIETNSAFNQKDECILSFDSDPEAGIYIPQVGRLVWHRKKRFSRNRYLCGIKFMEADEQVLKRMRSRVQKGVEQFVREKKVTTIAGTTLSVAVISAIGLLVWFGTGIYQDVTTANQRMLSAASEQIVLSQTYGNLYRASEGRLSEATQKLNIANQLIQEDKVAISLFSEELEATKALLNQTETMLIQANDRNVAVTNELAALKGQVSGATDARVLIPNANIETVEDARVLMADYRLKIRSLKGEIKRIREQERLDHIASMERFDDQKLMLGNNGFLVKDGEEIAADEQYHNLSLEQFEGKNIEIDVTFVE